MNQKKSTRFYDEPDYTKAGNYWRWLKKKLSAEDIQLVSGTHNFKFEDPDGKMRKADVLDFEGVQTLAKNYPNTRAGTFFDWFSYSHNTIDGPNQRPRTVHKRYRLFLLLRAGGWTLISL